MGKHFTEVAALANGLYIYALPSIYLHRIAGNTVGGGAGKNTYHLYL